MNLKKYIMIVCCVLGVCLAALSGVIVASRMFDGFPGLNSGADIDLPKPSKARANILIMGLDYEGGHTDTLMLVSLDNINKKIAVLSIPRDTRVIHEGQYDKLNHLYGYKGKEENTIKAVTQVTGVPIHYYVVVDFKGFRNIIDVLGGVEFDVPNIKNTGGMYYDDPAQDLHIALKAGKYVLNGKQAEGLVRFRKGYPDADIGRIKMQQEFIKALFEQKLQAKYLTKALSIYKEIAENVVTNYSIADATSHIGTFSAMGTDGALQTFSLPGYGADAYTRYGNLSCFIPETEEIKQIVDDYFKGTAVKIEETQQNQGENAE